MAKTQNEYRVIAGAVPMLHDRFKPSDGNQPKYGDTLPEDAFKEGEIGELLKGGFIEQVQAEEKAAKKVVDEKKA